MKNQCFGGEYMGEVFDHMLKRLPNAMILSVVSLNIEVKFIRFIQSPNGTFFKTDSNL